MDALPDEEKVRQVLRELRKRESSEEVVGDILRLQRVLEDPRFITHVHSLQSKSSTHLRTEPLSKDTKEPKTSSHNTGAVHRGSIRNLKRDDEASLCGQLKSNQKLLMVELDPSILVPTVLETCEEKPRLLVVGPRNIKSLSGSLIRIGDRIVAVSGRHEELRPATESSSPTPPSESACSRILVGIKSEFDGICERAITNGQRIGLALIREQTNMVLSGEWTQVEVVRLSTTSGGLGFGIVGGSSTGVVVKTILPGSPADKDKRLRPGDHILQIGKVNTQGMTSQQVASILRQQENVAELIVGRSIIPSEAPADCSDCWIMTTRAALNPARLEEEIREKSDNVLLRKKQTGTTDLLQNGHTGSVERPPTSPPPAPPSHPTQKSIDIDTGSQKGQKPETSTSNVSSPTEKTQKKSSVTSRTSEKRLSLDGSLSYGTSQGTATVAKSEMQPSTSSPPTVPQKLSLKALQEMALTVFLRENWEASGRFDTIDVVLHRDPTLGLGITVAGYVHRKAEIGGVFVKSLVPNSAAIQSGAIQIHDLILQVNGESLEHLSHADSVRTLVRSGDTVRLSLVRFHPRTPQSLCIEMLHNQETETQVIDVESSNPGLVAEWKKRLSGDVDIIQAVLRADTNQSGDGGLGIALEGTVDVVDGTQLCPHHYIGSIRRDGPAAKTGLLQAGDELLQVNHFSLFGESHVTVRNALTRAVLSNAPVTLIVARKTQQLNVFLPGGDRSLPLSYPLLASGSCQVVKAKSDICISGLKERTEELLEEVSRRLRSRSLEPLAGMAIWTCVPMVVWLQKDHRGLGFSVVDYKDPMHRGESVIVVQSLVPGGVAQADGRIVPGDRLLFVNDHDLSNSSLERAVAVLKAAPMGAVRLGVAKPIPVEQGGLSAHSPLISRSERFLAQGSSPTSSRRNKGSTHSSQETVWIGVDQYRRLHPQGYYPSRSPSAKSHQSSLNGSSLSMTSWSPCSSRSLSPCASPALSLKGSWAYDVIYLPAHLERTVKIPKGSLALGITLNAEKDKGVNGCVVKSVCGKKAIAKDGRIQVGDHIVMINNESLRDVTPAQARAILKRTNLMGSTCSITYITGSDAKLWKERFARDSEPQTPPISRLSPKVFPKFYKSPYMGGNNRLPRETSPDDTDVSLSLTHDHVDECLPGPSSSQIPVDSRVKSRFIDGLYVDDLAQELMQGAISDAVLELLFAQITPEWKGAKLEERRESSERPPLPSSPPPESIAEEETERRSTDIRIEEREECSSLERPVETVFIRRDSAPASTSSRLDVQTLNFPHLDSSEERSLGGGESEEKVEKIARPLTGETSEDLTEGVEKAEKSSELVIAKEEEELERKADESSERIENTEKIEETERRQSFEAEPETAEAEALGKAQEESSPVPASSPEKPPMSKVVVKPLTEVESQDEPQESKGTNGFPAIETLPSTSPQKPVDTETDKSAETQSLASSMDSTSKEKGTQKSKFWGEARTVILNRDPNKSFGISIVGGRVEVSQKGGLPGTGNTVSGIFIKTVLPDSPAGRTRMMSMGDRVLSVNDIDLRDATHEQAVKAIRTAENPVKFVLQSLHSFTPQQQMVTSPSASSSQSNAHVESVTVEERRKDPCVYGVPSTSDGRSSHSGSEPPVARNIHTQDSVDALARAGVEPGSAAALPRTMDDDGQPSPYGYTAKKISQKYGHLPGEVLLLEVEEVPEAGLGMSLQGKRYGEKMAVSVVSARAACPLPVLPGDELLEINGRVLFDLNHITASQKIRRCCEDGFVELLVLRRFQERRDSQPSKTDTDEPQENTDDTQAEETVTTTGEEKENESTLKDEDTTGTEEEGAENETDISHLESFETTENEKVAEVVEDTQDTVEEVAQQVPTEPLSTSVHPVEEVEEPTFEQKPATPPPATTNTRAAPVSTSAPMPPAQDDSAAALHTVDAVRKKSFVEKCTVIDTGKETLIEIDKDGKGLGLSIVGGSDTVLGTVVIHEVYPDGAAAIDGRLKPGDQVLEVNGVSLRGVTHEKAISLLRRTPPKVRLLVYRDVNLQLSLLDPTQIYNIFEVDLQKKPGRGLGLSIVGRKNEPGVYVSEVVKGGAADADGRLITGDQILSVNGTDVANSMQEDVAAMLKACVGKVQLKIGRWKITETATRVHAAAEAAYGKSTTTVTVPSEEVTSSSTSPRTEKSLPSSVREDLSPASSYSPSTPSSAPLPAPVPPPSLPTTSRPIITHTPPEGEGQEMPLSSGLSPVTEEPSSGTLEQSMHAEEDRSSVHPSSAGRTTPSVGAPSGSGITSGVSSPAPSVPSPSPSGFSGHCELLTELNEEGSDTVLIELRKHPEQQLGMGIGKRSRGILVTSLQPGSVAAEKLKVGDRILAVNALPVTDQLSAVTFVKASGERLFLQVARPRQNPHP